MIFRLIFSDLPSTSNVQNEMDYANLSDNFQISSRNMIDGSLNEVTNKQSFENISNVGNNKVINWGFTQVTGNNQFSANLERKTMEIDVLEMGIKQILF